MKSRMVFFSIHTYTHVQFEQLHKCLQNRNKIYKKCYTHKYLDISRYKTTWYI